MDRRRGLKVTRNQELCEPGDDRRFFNIVRLLKACTAMKDLHGGSKLHAYVWEHNCLGKNTYIGNTLVSMYAKCGAVGKAHQVLKELPIRNVVSWSALIAGYAQQGQGQEALKCYDDMLCEGHLPDAVTFICVLKACGSIGAAAKGEEIHEKIIGMDLLEKNIMLGNALVGMYAKCGALTKAHHVLKELPIRDVVSWTALIAGHAQQGQGEEALKCFDDMLCEGHSPNAVTFICVLKACGSIKAVAKGEEIHRKIVGMDMLEKNILLGNTLLDMYAKCDALAKAHKVLKELPIRDTVSWNALIAGYVQQARGEEALKCFKDMLYEGHSPNAVTFICILKACGSIQAVAKGEELHEKINSMNMLEKNIVLGTMLVDMYAKCGVLGKAHQVLKDLPIHDVVSWSALIAGYAQQGRGEQAMKCFDDMLHEGHFPDVITFTCVLKACGSIGAVAKGEEIHEKITSMDMLEKNIVLGNTLVDMYAKCGALAKAQQVLKGLSICDAVSWNALLAGYAQQGQSAEAMGCFDWMQSNGVKPDLISLTNVLTACSHSGLLNEAETYFSGMSTKYGLYPGLEHYSCMIDVFARAGKLKKALSVIAEMPNDRYLSSWIALLGACHNWLEVKFGALAFEHALNLDKCNAAVYVLGSDIYTAAGMQEEAHTIEVMRVANKAWEKPTKHKRKPIHTKRRIIVLKW